MNARTGPSLEGFPLSATGFVECMLSQAVRTGASDIHLERGRTEARLRYRLGGVLVRVPCGLFLYDEYSAVVARIRIMAALDIAEHRLPQDGRFSYSCEHGTADVRVSVLQAVSGERIVLRLLGAGPSDADFSALGMARREVEILERVVRASQGLVLVTGPTGSGKTTTLYTALNRINTDEISILSVEDPVERRLDDIGQVQVHEQVGLGFADVLRAFLRQDPEVILVGEIRDFETADIAFKAALTGHLVLSTLHTRDSATTIARLSNVGLSRHLIGSALSLVLSQRLVRVLCPKCKVEDEAPAGLPAGVEGCGGPDGRGEPVEPDRLNFFRAGGCEDCAWTGYRGRRGVFELLAVGDKVRDAILREAPAGEIARLLTGQGGMSLSHSCRRLLLAGVISLAEYQRLFAV